MEQVYIIGIDLAKQGFQLHSARRDRDIDRVSDPQPLGIALLIFDFLPTGNLPAVTFGCDDCTSNSADQRAVFAR